MTDFDPFNPLKGITPRFSEEELEEISTWFDSLAKPNLLIDEEPFYAVTIERFMNFLDLKKYHKRRFKYPTYFELMAKAEKLQAGLTRLLMKDQIIYMLDSWIIEPEIRHELGLAFKVFDTEQRDYLELDDIKVIVSSFDDPFDEAETIEILRDADTRGDGRVVYEDFMESIFSISPELLQEKAEFLYDDPEEDPSVEKEPEPEPEPELEPEPEPEPEPPPPPPPPPKKGKGKKK